MKYLVAVSGGIDSVVLLDMLSCVHPDEITVAHFDHGIRENSADDALFVRGLAEKYGVRFVAKRENLGEKASEELARTRRYAFLHSEAKKRNVRVVTAHHGDDIVESVAINLIRGTGWRGAAVLDHPAILRPLLQFTKEEIRAYALKHRLEWVEDETNETERYLRNRVRRKVAYRVASDSRRHLHAIRSRQIELRKEIDQLLKAYVRDDREYSRHLFIQIDPAVAREVLRAAVIAAAQTGPLCAQLDRALLAVKTARPGAVFEIMRGVSLRFTSRTFIVETS